MKVFVHFLWPRLDKAVTIQANHLIKLPFSIHKSTGKISIPLKLEDFKDFDILNKLPSVIEVFND